MKRRRMCGRSGQRGIAAIEFALISTLFFMIVFGIASLGSAFIVKQALSRAAEDGARAMLQASLAIPKVADAAGFACGAAVNSVQWLSTYRQEIASGPIDCLSEPAPCPPGASSMRCASVVVTYANYHDYPLIPALLPLDRWVGAMLNQPDGWIPRDLSARALVQLGLRAS